MIYCKALFASIPRRYNTLRSLSWVGTICPQTCGREHDSEWTAKAQHEAYTTIVGLSCLRNYHSLGSSNSVLMGNQVGQRFQIGCYTVSANVCRYSSVWYGMGVTYQKKSTGA
jgi:hypothetical protein